MIDPIIVDALCLLLGLLFGSAAWHKLSDPERFVGSLNDYALLPGTLIRPVSRSLPMIEAVLAVCWVLQLQPITTATASAVLLCIYTLAIAINLYRGRVHISCGCGTGADDTLISGWLLLRNLVLITGIAATALPAAERALGWPDSLLTGVAVIATLVIYLALGQLMSNAAAIGSWRSQA